MRLTWLRCGVALAVVVVAACGGSSGSGSGDWTVGADGGPSGSSSGSTSTGSGSGSPSGSGSGGSLVGDGGSTTTTLSPDAGCATATAKASRLPAYLLFVLDGSGSMGQDNKWTAVTGALNGIFAQMMGDPGLGVGLIVFADSMDMTISTGPGPYPEPGIDVPIGYVNAAETMALGTRLSGKPLSNTPTYYALQGGYGELSSFTAASPLESGGQKVLVLITDGVPTDHYCATSHAGTDYATNPCVTMAAMEHMAASPAGPIDTFVIGVGQFPSSNAQTFDPAWLGNLALAGGVAPAGCDPNQTQTDSNLCYFEVDPTQAQSATQLEQSFTTALQSIRGQVLSCTFPLQTTGLGAVDPSKVNVQVNGQLVPQGSTNGWTYDNPQSPTAIVFNGSSCASIKNDPNADVSIVLGCTTETAQ